MSKTVYLVSGANRGIGFEFIKALVKRDDTIVFAGARDPACAEVLHVLAQEHPGKLYIVKLVSADEAGNKAAVQEVKEKAGRLDVVIANAGIAKFIGPALETPAQEMRDHFEVNVIGALVLFQASYPLLKESTSSPKFVLISSGAGSITMGSRAPIGILPYGASKAAENYLARKLHFENEGLIVFPFAPAAPKQTWPNLLRIKGISRTKNLQHRSKPSQACYRLSIMLHVQRRDLFSIDRRVQLGSGEEDLQVDIR